MFMKYILNISVIICIVITSLMAEEEDIKPEAPIESYHTASALTWITLSISFFVVVGILIAVAISHNKGTTVIVHS